MRRLAADDGELGEDHSECTGNKRLQPGVPRINPVTASPNAVSKPAKRNRTNARGPCGPRLRTACQRQAGLSGHSVALGACRRRSGADRTTGARARCRRPPWPSRQGSGPR